MKPILQALVVADYVYQDRLTGKMVVAGIFHNIQFFSKDAVQKEAQVRGGMPVMQTGYATGSPFAYVSLTELRGEYKFNLRYVDLSNESVIFQIGFDVTCQDPLESVEGRIPLPMLPSDKAGTFALELLWNEHEPLGLFRIRVTEGIFGENNATDAQP